MLIKLEKFGTILMSRPAGRDAALALQSQLTGITPNESLEIDFAGVAAFAPSWGDEFLRPLFKQYPGRVILLNIDNPSVKATLEILGYYPQKP
ncbi:MAG: hypothetical protein V1719_01045 [Patescibacteria group bacterium]